MATGNGKSCKLGLYLFQEEGWLGEGSGTAGWSEIRAMTQTAEEIGFDSVWLPDRLMRVRDGELQGLWEAVTMLSAMAAVTSRIELGHAVLRSIYRNPALLVRMSETIDEISGGRFILGLGAGGATTKDPDEPAFGYPENYRHSRFEEALQIIIGLFKEGSIDFQGRFYSAEACVNRPRGPHPEGPPILIAAAGPKMLRLAARHADIWGVPLPALKPDVYDDLQASLNGACAEVGRDPRSIDRMAIVNIDPLSLGDAAKNPYGASLSGTPEDMAEALRAFPEAGFSHLVLVPFPNSPGAVAACAPILELWQRSK